MSMLRTVVSVLLFVILPGCGGAPGEGAMPPAGQESGIKAEAPSPMPAAPDISGDVEQTPDQTAAGEAHPAFPSLEAALRANAVAAARQFLEQGAAWPGEDEALFALLSDLADAGHRESLVLLHKAGADLRVAPGRRGRNTLLHHLAATGRSGLMGLLVELGLGVNVPNREGMAPLHVAVLSGQVDAVRELLLLGADPSLKTRDGKSALELAIAADHAEIVQVLTQPAHLNTP